MNTLLALARAAHYAGGMLVVGELVFVLLAGQVGLAHDSPGDVESRLAARRRMRVVSASLAVAFTADCAWLALQAGAMSGLPLPQALRFATLSAVLSETV